MRRFIFCLLFVAGCTDEPYRLPYVNGTEVLITNDDKDHDTPVAAMFDIRGTQPNRILAAAKEGWVREIKDSGDSSASTNNYVWIEHPLDYCQPVTPGGISTEPTPANSCKTCADGLGKCNEWTLYAHMRQNSVRLLSGLTEGDWVAAGQPIGIESDVGQTACGDSEQGQPLCGRHVHFAVFKIDRDLTSAQNLPDENGTYEFYAASQGRPELVPVFCTTAGFARVRTGETHIAANCPN